ncbi:MAG: hypothetical protein ACKVU4_12675 [Phycisphaerales bacterium]
MDTDSPPLRKPWYRPRNIILAVIALVLGWLGWAIYYSFSAEPGRSIDHARLLSELVEEYMPGEPGDADAWPLLLETFDREEAARALVWADREDWKGVALNYSELGGEPYTRADDGTPMLDTTRTWADAQARLRDAQRVLREQGVFDLLARLASQTRAIRPIRPDGRGRLFFMMIPELSKMRNLARMQRDRMVIAAESGDWADLAAAYDQTLALARIAGGQGWLIDYLVGVAIEQLAHHHMSASLVQSPPTDAAIIRAMLDALDRQTQPPVELALRGERVLLGDSIQWLHTDNGRGSGRLLFADFQRAMTVSGGAARTGVLTALGNTRLGNIAGFAFASKAQTIKKADEYFEGILRLAREPLTNRTAEVFDAATFESTIPGRYIMLKTFLPAVSSTLRSDELIRVRRAGTRALLHVDLFRIEHARPPESLDELAAGIAPELLIDPLNAKRFGYRKLAAPDQFGRTYLLYSIGADREDNGGKPNIQLNIASLQPGKAPGTDFVFNEPREYPEPPAETTSETGTAPPPPPP